MYSEVLASSAYLQASPRLFRLCVYLLMSVNAMELFAAISRYVLHVVRLLRLTNGVKVSYVLCRPCSLCEADRVFGALASSDLPVGNRRGMVYGCSAFRRAIHKFCPYWIGFIQAMMVDFGQSILPVSRHICGMTLFAIAASFLYFGFARIPCRDTCCTGFIPPTPQLLRALPALPNFKIASPKE